MTPGLPLILDRNHWAFFPSLDEVLEALEQGGPDDGALRRSFEDLADGYSAENALLLVVESQKPLR